jgi:hypothetical protein
MKRVRAFALALTVAGTALPMGCTPLKSAHYRHVQVNRSYEAWCDYEACQDCVFNADFKDGWLVGYYDVITGGTGVPPVVAPKRYWRVGEIVDNGDCGRMEWYRGFQVGVGCAVGAPDAHKLKLWMPACATTACPQACPTVTGTTSPGLPSSSSPSPATDVPLESETMPADSASPESDSAPPSEDASTTSIEESTAEEPYIPRKFAPKASRPSLGQYGEIRSGAFPEEDSTEIAAESLTEQPVATDVQPEESSSSSEAADDTATPQIVIELGDVEAIEPSHPAPICLNEEAGIREFASYRRPQARMGEQCRDAIWRNPRPPIQVATGSVRDESVVVSAGASAADESIDEAVIITLHEIEDESESLSSSGGESPFDATSEADRKSPAGSSQPWWIDSER